VLYLIIGVLAVTAVVLAAPMLPMLRRDARLRELARFRTARRLTTSWALGPRPLADGPAGEA